VLRRAVLHRPHLSERLELVIPASVMAQDRIQRPACVLEESARPHPSCGIASSPGSDMAEMELLEVRSRDSWRKWLSQHQSTSRGVWVVFYKAHTGMKSMPYEDFVREALCFGWIDSLVKRLDDDRFAIKVTPRKPASKWSDINRQRWTELKRDGLLTPAGLAAAPTENSYRPKPKIPELPTYIARAIKANPTAWSCFQKLPRGERRNFVMWIHVAKRPETRERRIRESIALLAAGKRLGLK
jgi:uncharacterized protein YdeI (YjbR/CyaY-like superfamily)